MKKINIMTERKYNGKYVTLTVKTKDGASMLTCKLLLAK